jgi:hypothetical protein
MADNIFSKVKESASAIKDKVSNLKEDIWGEEQKQIIQEFKDSGTAKIKEVLENIGIPPVIASTFSFIKDVSEEEQKKVLEETKKSPLIHLIISCLLKASNYFDKIKVGSYKMTSVSISLGLTPGVNINFTK